MQVLFAGAAYANGESQLLANFVAQSFQMGRSGKSRKWAVQNQRVNLSEGKE